MEHEWSICRKVVLAFEKITILGTGFYSQTKENSNSCLVLLSEVGIYGAFPFIWGLMLKPLILSRQHGYYHVGMLFLVFFVGYLFHYNNLLLSVFTLCFVYVVIKKK